VGIGSREKTAVELAGEVISAAGGLHGLNDVSSWYSSKPLMSSSVVELPLLLILRNFLKSEGQFVQQPGRISGKIGKPWREEWFCRSNADTRNLGKSAALPDEEEVIASNPLSSTHFE
jgi:hypothetical protein